MSEINNVLLICNLFIALITTLPAIPLVFKKIPPNSLYGFRMSKSFQSENNWYLINTYGGKQMILWGVIHLILLLIVWKFSTIVFFNAAVLYGGLLMPLIPIIITLLYARKL